MSERQPRNQKKDRKKDREWKANSELPQLAESDQGVEIQSALGNFMTPTECFELFFDKSLVKNLVDIFILVVVAEKMVFLVLSVTCK